MRQKYFSILSSAILCVFLIISSGCGGGNGDGTHTAGNTTTATEDGEDSDDDGNTVNTEKLIGTPLEGLTVGDDLNIELFLCGKYRTETIDAPFPTTPIKIFAAFFTADEEAWVQEGVDLANTGMGFTAYELTDTWSDDIRIIYRVDDLTTVLGNSAGGHTSRIFASFDGKSYSETEAPDWAIVIDDGTTNSSGLTYAIAHELGHASGIQNHQLIDYVNDTRGDFNDANSIMEADSGTDTGDYNFMMSMQGQIMEDHLGQEGTLTNASITEAECEAEGLGN